MTRRSIIFFGSLCAIGFLATVAIVVAGLFGSSNQKPEPSSVSQPQIPLREGDPLNATAPDAIRWIYWPNEQVRNAANYDVFYLPSGRAGIFGEKRLFRDVYPREVGPFAKEGAIYAPNVGADPESRAVLRSAFLSFLNQREPTRPFLIVGYGKAAWTMAGFSNDFGAETYKHLAAAYFIEPSQNYMEVKSAIPVCSSSAETGCMVSFSNKDGINFPCVENWRAASVRPSGGGAIERLELGLKTPATKTIVSAQCNGDTLQITYDPAFNPRDYPKHFNPFFHDLANDAARRTLAKRRELERAALSLDPITEELDVIDSPINKVPN
ncbi:MAG: DUF3089 domain-containing protein [Pseudomonadota bacterium]